MKKCYWHSVGHRILELKAKPPGHNKYITLLVLAQLQENFEPYIRVGYVHPFSGKRIDHEKVEYIPPKPEKKH